MIEQVAGISSYQEVNAFESSRLFATGGNANQFALELEKVNNKLISSEHLLQDLASGKTDNIHHVMLALEDAKLSLQLLVQVRNKLLESYQDVLRMQV
jgi:flagellar hook-basal body complex protein FliE